MIERSKLDPVDAAKILELASLLKSHTESLTPGRPISIPSGVYWNWAGQQNPVTVEYMTTPDQLAMARSIMDSDFGEFANNPRNIVVVTFAKTAFYALVIVAVLLPPIILYCGGAIAAKIFQWVADGFSKT